MRPLASLVLALAVSQSLPTQAADANTHDPKIEGVVFFSLPKSLPGEFLALRSASSGTEYRIGARPLGKDGPRGNVMWLPAGDYQVVGWSGTKLADYPTLTIEAGRLTDGGTIMAFPVGDRKLVVLPVRPADTAHDLDAAVAELGPALNPGEPLVWQVKTPPKPADLPAAESPLGGVIPFLLAAYEAHANKATVHRLLLEAETPDAFYAIARQATPPLTTMAVADPDGRELFGADLGQIRVRAPSGEWSALDTGTLHPVTVVAAVGQRLVAGYDDGTLRASDDKGLTWRTLASPAPGWRVSGIAHVGDRWFVSATGMIAANPAFSPTVDRIRLYTAMDADLKDATLVREFKDEEGVYTTPHLEQSESRLYLLAQPALWRFDVAAGTWSSLPTPGDVADFHLGDAGVIAAWRAKGMFSKLYVSPDDGASWKKIDHPSLQITDIRMFDATHGVAVRLNPGAFSNTKEIHTYDAAHDDWRLSSEAPQGCLRLLVDATRHPRYCVTSGASILGLVDGKWVAEYTTQ